jgi:hypothetical protein
VEGLAEEDNPIEELVGFTVCVATKEVLEL